MSRMLITGSRAWTDVTAIENALRWATDQYPQPVTVVHGAAAGADRIAGEVAESLGWAVEEHPADWKQYGKAAGPRRNSEMVALGADVVLAFPLGASPGTRGCMRLARKAGLLVVDWAGEGVLRHETDRAS